MDKIKNIHIENLINDYNKKKEESKEPVIVYNGLKELTEAMKFDYNLLYYTDVNKFINLIYHHKIMEWNNIACVVGKENKIVLFNYINKR